VVDIIHYAFTKSLKNAHMMSFLVDQKETSKMNDSYAAFLCELQRIYIYIRSCCVRYRKWPYT